MNKALELWKRWFDWSGDPWVIEDDNPFGKYCFFCGGDHPDHEPNCAFVEANKLVDGQMEVEGEGRRKASPDEYGGSK